VPDATTPGGQGLGTHVDFAPEVGPAARQQVSTVLDSWDRALFGADVAVRPLPGGANNQNYVVTSGARRYALRIANQDNERMAVDRDSARRAQADAADLGVAPAVLAHCGGQGHLLSEFVEGTALSVDTIGAPEVLTAIATTFRTLHRGISTCRTFDPFADIEMWIDQATESGVTIPAEVAELRRRALTVRDAIDALALPKTFCHNDTVPQNFMWDGHRIVLVDWDYAGYYYPAFELGSFTCTADLTDAETEHFLRAYDPTLDDPARARVTLMQFVAGLREIAWVLNASAMLRGTTMVADSFYDDYLANNLRRARRFGLADRFTTVLDRAAVRGITTI
jgi:thiamine kinase-like enzyme